MGSDAKLSELRFLAVEDQGFQLWIIGKLLEELGARYVVTAADGESALQVIAQREPPIDIIISDIDMPGMDGMEFMRHLAAANSSASLILASALERRLLDGIETMARAYNLSVLGVISKPVTAKKLEAIIARHAARPVPANVPAASPSFSASELADGLKLGQFVAYFQPKVNVLTGAVKGAEVLARWKHPQHGIIRPDRFISGMEQGGMIEDLTMLMTREAVASCLRWRAASVDATVSINVSALSLGDIKFGNELLRAVTDGGLDPRHVVIELTESVNVADAGTLLENLSRLRMKGFGLSIDDFGMGYSSMERLAGVAFTELKIDQSFVRLALTHEPSRAMLESGLAMAKRLRMTAVAEGIESRGEWALIRSLGCELAQGYFVQRPIDALEFDTWLKTPHAHYRVKGRAP